MIKNLKDMYNVIRGGKSFGQFVTDYYPDSMVETSGNRAYVDQDFYDFWSEFGAEIYVNNKPLTDDKDDEQNYYVFHKANLLLIVPCWSVANRHGKDLGDEVFLDLEKMIVCEKIKHVDFLEDKKLGEALDYVDDIDSKESYWALPCEKYLVDDCLIGAYSFYDLGDLIEIAIDYLEPDEDDYSEEDVEGGEILGYLNSIASNYIKQE